ncbi:hypothetical protein QKW35_08540 [Pontibacterium granulatum]|nr:hypothetical protein [Pontibacterium granulatum]MDI3324421.1 hypothetical protein [Pontibacterium granulatum]
MLRSNLNHPTRPLSLYRACSCLASAQKSLDSQLQITHPASEGISHDRI